MHPPTDSQHLRCAPLHCYPIINLCVVDNRIWSVAQKAVPVLRYILVESKEPIGRHRPCIYQWTPCTSDGGTTALLSYTLHCYHIVQAPFTVLSYRGAIAILSRHHCYPIKAPLLFYRGTIAILSRHHWSPIVAPLHCYPVFEEAGRNLHDTVTFLCMKEPLVRSVYLSAS